jgi:hypothetical protein
MSKKDRENIRVSAGKLQIRIRDIQSLPKNRRVVMETKDAN